MCLSFLTANFTSFSLGRTLPNNEKVHENQARKMVQSFDQVLAVSEEGSLSDSVSGGSDEKTIPFLKRLRDMLQENEGVISFIPGHRKNGQVTLGRLVVHDRIVVEANVLPRYFNHSSFASLRRQLNYFSFVRLGKGRQRESTYINEGVVELDDILALRRRSTGSTGQALDHHVPETQNKKEKADGSSPKTYLESVVPVVHLPSKQTRLPKSTEAKRARQTKLPKKKKFTLPALQAQHHFISEDEQSHDRAKLSPTVALDLTQPATDPEVLEGCTALLGLSGRLWE